MFNANGARRPVSRKEREKLQGEFPYYGATGRIDSLNGFTHEGEHVLVGEDGANLFSKSKNLAFVVDGRFWVNNHAHAIRCLADAPNNYVEGFINSLDISKWVTGSAQPKLTKANLESIVIPIASPAEQKQIAARLDELLAHVNTIKTRLDTIPAILKRFRQSVLAAAVSGRLTEDWRVNMQDQAREQLQRIKEDYPCKPPKGNLAEFHELPKSWEWALVREIGMVQRG